MRVSAPESFRTPHAGHTPARATDRRNASVTPGAHRPIQADRLRTYTSERARNSPLFVFHSNVCLAQPFESYYRCLTRETIREGPT